MCMQPIVDRIQSILGETETQLRNLIAEAAVSADYRGVDAGRQAAVGIRELRERFGENPTKKVVVSESDPRTAESPPRRARSAARATRKAYPRFTVEDDTLTKIGWSKKHKREYAHRVVLGTFDRTVSAMATLANGKTGPFLAEDIIGKVNESDEDQVPSYQVYIVIAFLRASGCIRQHGRDGYDVHRELVASARGAWEKSRHNS
jgi:hypothetical protein